MRKGEKGILLAILLITGVSMAIKGWQVANTEGDDPGIPFYSTASDELAARASVLYRKHKCRDCHVIWGVRDIMQAVPAPSLDGMGSLRDEAWLFAYFSAENPQGIIPSRLKQRFQMPSFAHIPEADRRTLASYIFSLKVDDWYLEETKKSAYEKLTGKEYQQ